MQNLLIGMAGKAGSGKDTAANILKKHYPFESVAFADPIRAGMRAIIGLDDKHFAHPDKEVVLPEFGKSPRQMMQTLGTEWGRVCVNEDLWLILAMKQVAEFHSEGYDAIITDVRFENEAKLIRDNGGTLIHIRRGDSTAVSHVSEAGVAVEDTDIVIYNNGTLKDLEEMMTAITESLYIAAYTKE